MKWLIRLYEAIENPNHSTESTPTHMPQGIARRRIPLSKTEYLHNKTDPRATLRFSPASTKSSPHLLQTSTVACLLSD